MAKKKTTKRAKTSKTSQAKKVENKKEKMSSLKNIIPTDTNSLVTFGIFLLIGLIVGALVSYGAFLASGNTEPGVETNTIPIGDIASVQQDAEDYLNTNLLNPQAQAEGVEFILSDGNDLGNGLYEFGVYVDQNGQEQLIAYVYSTKDKLILGQGKAIDLSENGEESTGTAEPAEGADLEKSDKPVVDLYVMSFCPYGNKAEDTLLPAYNLLKDDVDLNVHYIVNFDGNTVQSLHGQPEIDQDMREACVLENSGIDAWFRFATEVNANCGSDGSCWKSAAETVDLDVNEIKTCFENEGLTLMEEDALASKSAGATGSPTMFINGTKTNVVYQYGDSDAYKQAICSAFNEEPETCAVKLDSTTASTGGSC